MIAAVALFAIKVCVRNLMGTNAPTKFGKNQDLNKITDKIQIDDEKEKEATTIIKKKSPDVTVQGMGSEKPHNFLNTGSKVTYFL